MAGLTPLLDGNRREDDYSDDGSDYSSDASDEYGIPAQYRLSKTAKGLLFVCVVLVTLSERVCFKVLVDRAVNYRLFLVEMVCVANWFMSSATRYWNSSEVDEEMLEFPKWKFFVFAMFDTVQLFLVFIPGALVPDALTVTILQSAIPFLYMINAGFRGDWRMYDRMHNIGVALIVVGIAVSIALVNSKHTIDSVTSIVVNCILYAMSGLIFAVSTISKEKMVATQPMRWHYLNQWTSGIQAVLVIIFAPVGFAMKDVTSKAAWKGLSYNSFSPAWGNAGYCVFGSTDTVPGDHCSYVWILLIGYTVSAMISSVLLTRALMAFGLRMTGHLMNAGLVLAFVVLCVYGQGVLPFLKHTGPALSVNVFEIIAACLVFVGTVTYQWKEEPDVVQRTPYPTNPASEGAFGATPVMGGAGP